MLRLEIPRGSSPQQNRHALTALVLCEAVFSVTQGLSYPLLSMVLHREGSSSFAVAVSASMVPLGVVASSPLLPKVTARVRRTNILLTAITISAFSLLLMGLMHVPSLWLPLRFVHGMAISAVYLTVDTAILQIAPLNSKGKICATATIAATAGYAIGPALLAITGLIGFAPFGCDIALLLLAALPILVTAWSVPTTAAIEHARQQRAPLRAFLPLGWPLLVAYVATTFFDNSFMSLFPVYCAAKGLPEHLSGILLSAVFVGGLMFQYPIGVLADRISRRTVIIVCGLVAFVAALAVSRVIATTNLSLTISAVGILGAAVLGLETATLTELGGRFTGGLLSAGNAVLSIGWGLSALCGIPAAGMAMEIFGPSSLVLIVATTLGLAVVAAAFDSQSRRSQEE